MSSNIIGLLIGGVGAAFLFGFSGVMQKASMSRGISLGPYMVTVGLTILLVGGVTWMVTRESNFNLPAIGAASLFAGLWALGTLAVAFALQRYGSPISLLNPLYNMNTLVAVVLGLFVFSEWDSVDVKQLIPGAVLIILGGVLCARASS
jgi:hypothetical protein